MLYKRAYFGYNDSVTIKGHLSALLRRIRETEVCGWMTGGGSKGCHKEETDGDSQNL